VSDGLIGTVRERILEIGRSWPRHRRPGASGSLAAGAYPVGNRLGIHAVGGRSRQESRGPGKHELCVSGLSVAYGRREVVRGVDLRAVSGRVVGLLGPNGAGKTTILHATVGLIRANAGTVQLNGRDITALPMYERARAGIAYLPQESSIFRRLTVAQNLMIVLESSGLPAKERLSRASEALEKLGIARLANAPAWALSGGERRRTEVARALVLLPGLLLLDEPFAGIDPIAVAEIQRTILQLSSEGIGVLISDHNVRETLRITDEAYIVVDGRVFLHGSPSELAASPRVRRLYLGEDFVLDGRRPAAARVVA
jgi:lipopolysaccharide export system ATP-binding protein